MIFTSVLSVVAVSAVALFFIPHWTAVLFVIPFICCLYVNMLGFLYISGVQVNAISYVTLVMSIGLMIDVSIAWYRLKKGSRVNSWKHRYVRSTSCIS